jgi:uncharacterized membrane protein
LWTPLGKDEMHNMQQINLRLLLQLRFNRNFSRDVALFDGTINCLFSLGMFSGKSRTLALRLLILLVPCHLLSLLALSTIGCIIRCHLSL